MRWDPATQVRLSVGVQDGPVVIEVGRRESHDKLEFFSVGSRLPSDLPDRVGVFFFRVSAKGNERHCHGAVWWPLILLYLQL